MQVILFRNIERLGMQGDIVNVAGGYYRNYLGPRGIAAEATEAALKRIQLKRKKMQAAAEVQRNEAQVIARRLAGLELRFTRKTIDGDKLFGSVTEHDILEQLKENGYELKRGHVMLREAIKSTGTHAVRVRLEANQTADLKVIVEAEGGAPTEHDEVEAEAPVADDETPAEPPSEA